MKIENTTSSTKAGALEAGQALDHLPLSQAIAEAQSVADCIALRPWILRRKVAAVAAADAHGQPDPLLEDDQLAAFTAEANRLAREVARCDAALERLDLRQAEFQVAEAQAAARIRITGSGAVAAKRAEVRIGRYVEIAEALKAELAGLDEDVTEILAARQQAQEAGIGDEAMHLKTPAESRFRPAEFALVEELIEPNRAPRITDAAGKVLDGRGHHQASSEHPAKPMRRMVERMVRPPASAPDLTRIAIYLPSPEPDAAPLVSRRGDG